MVQPEVDGAASTAVVDSSAQDQGATPHAGDRVLARIRTLTWGFT